MKAKVLTEVVSSIVCIGSGMVGYQACRVLTKRSPYFVVRALTNAGIFGISEYVSAKVSDHIQSELDTIVDYIQDTCKEALKEKEEETNATIIDISPAPEESE